MVEVGPQGVGGEVVFPEAWRQGLDLARAVLADALQDMDKVSVGIDTVQSARHDEGMCDAGVFGTDLSPARHPVLAFMHICA